jgi:hypothetical protein
MNQRVTKPSVSKDELDFVTSFGASIAAAVIAGVLLIVATASSEHFTLGDAQAATETVETTEADAAIANSSVQYFPDLFEQTGAVEEQPATF